MPRLDPVAAPCCTGPPGPDPVLERMVVRRCSWASGSGTDGQILVVKYSRAVSSTNGHLVLLMVRDSAHMVIHPAQMVKYQICKVKYPVRMVKNPVRRMVRSGTDGQNDQISNRTALTSGPGPGPAPCRCSRRTAADSRRTCVCVCVCARERFSRDRESVFVCERRETESLQHR